MAMARLQLYQNKYRYPEYLPTDQLRPHGNEIDVTPKNISSTGGTLHLAGNHSTFHSCNYLRYTRNGVDVYAWITDFTQRTDKSYDVTYEVDAFRTYYHDIDWGTQYIKRSPTVTSKKDDLLGSSMAYPETMVKKIGSAAHWNNRVLVVQVRSKEGESIHNTPVQPLPYKFYFCSYDIRDWLLTPAVNELITALRDNAESQNIVTLYSVPWFQTANLDNEDLEVTTADGTTTISGWKVLPENTLGRESFYNEFPLTWDFDPQEITRVSHSVKILITDAGVIDVPAELFSKPDLKLRQDIDIYSGASNYMLVSGDRVLQQEGLDYTEISDYEVYPNSVRGSAVSSIPIVSDPLDTYLSQNQNALTTSMIGDVASIAGGAAMTIGTGGLGAMAGGAMALNGVTGMVTRQGSIEDIASKYSNPPAFLGTALVNNFNSRYYVIVNRMTPSNAEIVNSNFGYPMEMIWPLNIPSEGFIQTEGCNVATKQGWTPRWALDAINTIMNNGLYVHDNW